MITIKENAQVKVVSQDEHNVRIVVYFRESEGEWLQVKLRVPKNALRVVGAPCARNSWKNF